MARLMRKEERRGKAGGSGRPKWPWVCHGPVIVRLAHEGENVPALRTVPTATARKSSSGVLSRFPEDGYINATKKGRPGRSNMSITGPSPQLRRMQWVAIILVTAAIALNYMDSSTLAIGNLKIREEFGISATAIGALGSAWALTYGFAQLPSGYLLDRIGPKVLVGATMIVWSLFQAVGGITSNYFQLMLSRIGLGATEAPCFPSATRSVSDWFDVKDRGAPSGVYTSGAYIGPTIAPPILTAVMLAFNWRVMFIVMGLAGIVAAGLWFMIYRDPRAQVLEPQDADYLRANREAKSGVSFRQWTSLFRFRAMWVL